MDTCRTFKLGPPVSPEPGRVGPNTSNEIPPSSAVTFYESGESSKRALPCSLINPSRANDQVASSTPGI